MSSVGGTESVARITDEVASMLSTPISLYLVGPEPETNQWMTSQSEVLDIVVSDERALTSVRQSLSALDFTETSTSFATDQEAIRNFRFAREDTLLPVCLTLANITTGIHLTEGVRSRSAPYLARDQITIRTLSRADQFLFHLLAGEQADLETLVAIQTSFELDVEVLETEVLAQILTRNDDAFISQVENALAELVEHNGVSSQLLDRVQQLADRYYRGREVLDCLDEPKTINQLEDELHLPRREVIQRVRYLLEFRRVTSNNGLITPTN